MKQALRNGFRRFFGRGSVPGEHQKEYPLVLEKPDALIIQCCDFRFWRAFEQFAKDMRIRNPIKLVMPGSVHDFAAFGNVATEKIGFCIDLLPEGQKRVIVIAHEDCKWCSHHGNPVEENLRAVEAKFARKFPHVELELYMAIKRTRKGTVFFRRFDRAITTEN